MLEREHSTVPKKGVVLSIVIGSIFWLMLLWIIIH